MIPNDKAWRFPLDAEQIQRIMNDNNPPEVVAARHDVSIRVVQRIRSGKLQPK